MKKSNVLYLIISVFCNQLQAQSPQLPFPRHAIYTAGTIKPNNFTQTQLDNQVKTFYDTWKATYLSQHCSDNTQYYIKYLPAETQRNSTSEGHGYGMMIVAYMAGYDPAAKTYFDGLYKWSKLRDSSINPLLMEWRQGNNCSSLGESSATDGDVYIAYALLLADKQWGSTRTINYKGDAITLLTAIKQSEINTAAATAKLGDWVDANSSYINTTRSSDFLTTHYKSFKDATNDATWDNITNKCYSIISYLQTNYSPTTGLLPDFVINANTVTPAAPAGQVLETSNDGSYFYNACRDPWNLGVDYLVNGDVRAKNAVEKITTWIKSTTSNDINNIQSEYKLDGSTLNQNYKHLAFIAPFAVGACVDVNNQTWLNNLWSYIVAAPLGNNGNGYYGDIIKMQCMIIVSGNYWTPQNVTLDVTDLAVLDNKFNSIAIYPNPSRDTCTLHFYLKDASDVVLTLTNTLGKTIYSKNYTSLSEGANTIALDLKKFASGNYFCQINSGKTKTTGRLVIN
jgi:endoglucanase